MTGAATFSRYAWRGGEEWMMRLASDGGPVVMVALPLFEEANRTRAVATATMRALADAGIATALPDMPGQGDSLTPTQDVSLSDLREAFEGATAAVAAEGRAVYVAAIRSGALLDLSALAHGRWHLSPQEGAALLRELTRIGQQEVGRERAPLDGTLPAETPGPPVSIAGNLVSPDLLAALSGAMLYDEPAVPKRVVRLDGDPRPADRRLTGAPPWRRAEPGNDDALAQVLAADIADWVRTCAAR